MFRGFLFLVFLGVAPLPALAYIDPGTGSMLVQSVLAGVAAVLVFGRTVWARVKQLFSRRKSNDDVAGH